MGETIHDKIRVLLAEEMKNNGVVVTEIRVDWYEVDRIGTSPIAFIEEVFVESHKRG